MDRLAYLASAGAKQLLHRQETIAHNLANANTTGFRADLDAFRAVPVQGPGPGTRVFVAESTPGFDSTPGTLQTTGRNLDIAIEGEGFFAVESRDGSEAFTRAGSLDVGADSTLRTRAGLAVQGDGGPIVIPENARVAIGRDGTVSAIAAADNKSVTVVGRIKLVNPPTAGMVKGGDGLFRATDGNAPATDANVRLVDGTLEGSNVNLVDALVGMISVARQFETQMRLMSSAEQNSRDANKLLSATG
jgi:flagellar basal-body rod protein FlgF